MANKLLKSIIVFYICIGVMACSMPPNLSNPSVFAQARKDASSAFADDQVLIRIDDIPVGDLSQYRIQFIGEQEGWLANGSKLWRTTDGGTGWSLKYTADISGRHLGTIECIQFINPRTGWILVSPAGIYKTEDGGNSWAKQNNPFPDGTIYAFSFFKDGKQGWASGIIKDEFDATENNSPRDHYPVISHTVDGGRHWNRQIISGTKYILGFHFIDEEHGWARGSPGLFYLESKTDEWKLFDLSKSACPNKVLLRTTRALRNGSGIAFAPAAIFFLDKNQGWLSFENGYVASTIDGGLNWCDLLNPRDVWPIQYWDTYFTRLYFIDSNRGWGLSAAGILHESKDGGVSWQKVHADKQFGDLFLMDGSDGWAVAEDGLFRIRVNRPE